MLVTFSVIEFQTQEKVSQLVGLSLMASDKACVITWSLNCQINYFILFVNIINYALQTQALVLNRLLENETGSIIIPIY